MCLLKFYCFWLLYLYLILFLSKNLKIKIVGHVLCRKNSVLQFLFLLFFYSGFGNIGDEKIAKAIFFFYALQFS